MIHHANILHSTTINRTIINRTILRRTILHRSTRDCNNEQRYYYVPRFRGCSTAYLTHFILYIAILSLTACSYSNPIKANSLELNKKFHSSEGRYSLEEIDQDPFLYKIIDNSVKTDVPPPFITALKQCGGVGRTASTLATTRQLLTGLRNISIKRQQPLIISQKKVLFSQLSASLDNRSLTLFCFSSREDDCVTDLIAWNQNEYIDPLFIHLSSANEDELSSWIAEFSIFK